MPLTKREQEVRALLAEREAFANLSEWKRSKKGNLWRHYEGVTVTIIGRRDGFFNWCLADGDGPRFSTQVHDTEEEAIESAATEFIF